MSRTHVIRMSSWLLNVEDNPQKFEKNVSPDDVRGTAAQPIRPKYGSDGRSLKCIAGGFSRDETGTWDTGTRNLTSHAACDMLR